jgi:hypothetical protein
MRRIIQKLPAMLVLLIGTIVIVWGACVVFKRPQPEPAPQGGTTRFEPPTIAEMIGIEPGGEKLQGLFAIGVGGVAVLLAVFVLRQEDKES